MFNRTHQPQQTDRPRDSDEIRVVITEPVYPGGEGKCQLVWPDPDDAAILLTHPRSVYDPDPGYTLPSNHQFAIKDANECNCLLPGELCWARFDSEIGTFVPIGSKGLIRKAKSTEAIDADASGTFGIVKDGSEIHYDPIIADISAGAQDSIDITVEVYVEAAVADNTDETIVFRLGELDNTESNAANRVGRWEILRDIRPHNITFQAPSGGIPAASSFTPGSATVDILVRDTADDEWKSSGTATVYSFATSAICDEGLRLGWAIFDGRDYVAISKLCGDERTYADADTITAPEAP